MVNLRSLFGRLEKARCLLIYWENAEHDEIRNMPRIRQQQERLRREIRETKERLDRAFAG